jgi:MFS family permease
MFRTPRWFYTFIPFKFAAGCSSTLIPLLIIAQGGTATDISIISGAYSTMSMVFLIIWGKWSDATQKRKPFLVLGFLGFSISLFLFAFSQSLTHVFSIQLFSASFFAATVPVSSVFLLRSARKEYWDRAIGEFNKIGGFGWAFGMLLGTVSVALLGIEYLFILLGCISLISAVLFQKMVREKPIYLNRTRIKAFVNAITERFRYVPSYIIQLPQFTRFESKKLQNFYLASFLLFASSRLVITPFIYFMTVNGASSSMVFLVSFINTAVAASLFTTTAKHVALFGGFSILGRGIKLRAVLIAIIVAASFSGGLYGLLLGAACFCLFGYSWAQITISSNSLMSKMAIKGKEGNMMGMYNFMTSLGIITGNLISGVIVDALGFSFEFSVAFIIMLSSLIWIHRIKAWDDAEMKDEVKTGFEKTAQDRLKWWTPTTFQQIDGYLDLAGAQNKERVLDAATGDGIVANRLAKRGCEVTALDISSDLFWNKQPEIDYKEGDAEQMEFMEGFDLITLRNAFHYFPNPQKVISRIHASLREGGKFLLMEPVATEESYPFLKRVYEKKAPVRHFFSEEDLLTMIGQEGFTIGAVVREDYSNWIKSTTSETGKGIKTYHDDGILYFTIPQGYIIIVAQKLPIPVMTTETESEMLTLVSGDKL